MINFPDTPTVNQIFTSPAGAVYSWDGQKWKARAGGGGGGGGSAGIVISDTAPSSPAVGNLWFDSVGALTYLWINRPDGQQDMMKPDPRCIFILPLT